MNENKRTSEDRRVADRRLGWLVSDWKAAHRWLSVQIPAGLAVVATVYEMLPAAQAYVPANVFRWLMIIGLVCAILGRLLAQPKAEPQK